MSFTESEINPSYPTERDATTASVRDNFAIAHREITAINEAISVALTGAPYLSISGGELTGRLLLPGDPDPHLRAAVSRGWVESFVAGETGAGLPEAPSDGTTYGRANLLWSPVLPLAGGVLTGLLTLAGPPTVNLHAATKAYVDSAPPVGGPYLPLAGGLLTGALTLAGPPTADLHAASKEFVDSSIATLQSYADNNFLSLYGGTLMGLVRLSGAAFVNAVASSTTDLSRHIALYDNNYGFNLTSGRINYVLPPGAMHVFIAGGGDRMSIGPTGVTMLETANLTLAFDPTLPLHAATKGYVDAALAALVERVTALEARR